MNLASKRPGNSTSNSVQRSDPPATRPADILGNQLSNTACSPRGIWAILDEGDTDMEWEPSGTNEAPGASGLHPSGCCNQTNPPGPLVISTVQKDQGVATQAATWKPSTKRVLQDIRTEEERLAPEPVAKRKRAIVARLPRR